jgi:hypothetical protein
VGVGARCRRFLCAQLWLEEHAPDILPAGWEREPFERHAEGCPLWEPPLPGPGERPVFGVHRLRQDEAETAEAWPSQAEGLARARQIAKSVLRPPRHDVR